MKTRTFKTKDSIKNTHTTFNTNQAIIWKKKLNVSISTQATTTDFKIKNMKVDTTRDKVTKHTIKEDIEEIRDTKIMIEDIEL